jgi:hypothetical protein
MWLVHDFAVLSCCRHTSPRQALLQLPFSMCQQVSCNSCQQHCHQQQQQQQQEASLAVGRLLAAALLPKGAQRQLLSTTTSGSEQQQQQQQQQQELDGKTNCRSAQAVQARTSKPWMPCYMTCLRMNMNMNMHMVMLTCMVLLM